MSDIKNGIPIEDGLPIEDDLPLEYPDICNSSTDSPENNCLSDIKAKIIILGNLIGLVLYLFDIITDSYSADQHYNNSNYLWFGLTLASIIIPIIIASIGVIYIIIHTDKCSERIKILLVPTAIFCSPIVPFSILVWKFVDSIRRYPDNDVTDDEELTDSTLCAGVVHFLQPVMQSFPQAAIQMYIICQYLSKGEVTEHWQWLTVLASLLALAYYISTNDVFVKIADMPIVAKAGVFVFVLLIAASRILVSCIYSTIFKGLIFLPIGVELCAFINCCICKVNGKGYWAFIIILVSFSNLCFAIGGCFLPELPFSLTLTTLIIATVSWLATYIFTYLFYHDKF